MNNGQINITFNGETVFEGQRRLLQRQWAETSYQIQRLRDNAECAGQEFDVLLEEDNPGLSVKLSYDVNQDVAAPYIKKGIRPQVAHCCVSRASTVRWKWRPRSTAPVSTRSTCT